MEFIIIATISVICILVLGYIFDYNMKKIKHIADDKELDEAAKKYPNNIEMCKYYLKKAEDSFGEDITETLTIIGKSKSDKTENYQDALKLLNARINNLESNLHIEIDMERIEDRSKALSYIGIEIADALKSIPTPVEETIEEVAEAPVQAMEEQQQYVEETTFEAKPSLWQRIKNSKVVRAIKAITRIRIVVDYSDALPEGRGENN